MVEINNNLKQILPSVRLLCFRADVEVKEDNKDLWNEIESKTQDIRNSYKTEDISKIPVNSATREVYRLLGKDPSRYRPSAEALLRRIVSGKGLYRINNVVDMLNLISVSTGFSIGGYDVDKISGKVELCRATSSDIYQAIGRGELNIENLPVLKDQKGCFGTPTSDSLRTMVTASTTDFLMVFFCFDNGYDKEVELENAVSKLFKKYAFSKRVKSFIIK